MKRRWLEERLARQLARPYVHILVGARQTGKSTLLRKLVPDADLWIDLSDPAQRSRFLARPELLVEQCAALPRTRRARKVVVDEAQAVPAIFDAVQHLFDRDRRRFRFILSGSSARKLRRSGANLLPGRSMLHRLFPLVLAERPAAVPEHGARSTPLLLLPAKPRPPLFPTASLVERLACGDLPGIALAPRADREPLLKAYAYVYLEEELRREALIKDWPVFARFLRFAALESGRMINFARIARQAGTSLPTVKSYFQLLEDMFVGFRIDAWSGSTRKHVPSCPTTPTPCWPIPAPCSNSGSGSRSGSASSTSDAAVSPISGPRTVSRSTSSSSWGVACCRSKRSGPTTPGAKTHAICWPSSPTRVRGPRTATWSAAAIAHDVWPRT
jgi:predicted AAA+ superfamily ATPase